MTSQFSVPHSLSFVIPVFSGEGCLDAVVSEILELDKAEATPGGLPFKVREVILVHDGGSIASASTMRRLAALSPLVYLKWLTTNFGQHPATIAGMSSTSSDWVITLDEDGQFNPADVPTLLDAAIQFKSPLVYGVSNSAPPHSKLRNFASSLTKRFVAKILVGRGMADFSSFRLILGDVARGVAAYAGPGTYLDVALHWTANSHQTVQVRFRHVADRQSTYSHRKLLGHFWRLVLSSGTKPLRFVSYIGITAAGGGFILAVLVVLRRILYGFPIGFASVFVALLLLGGLLLVSIGVIAEYIGLIARSTVGRPLYISQSDPGQGPLSRQSFSSE